MSLVLLFNGVEKTYIEKPISDEDLVVPSSGKFYRILHDAEIYGYPRQKFVQHKNREVPATRPLWGAKKLPTSDFYPMLTSWQFRLYELFRATVGEIPEDGDVEYWWYEDPEKHGKRIICKKGTPYSYPQYYEGTLKDAYMSFIEDHRAFTDRHAFNTDEKWYREDVIGINPKNPKPYMFKALTTTGNIVKVLDVQPEGIDTKKFFAIETFDFSKDAPSIGWILNNKPYLIWWATEQGGFDRELSKDSSGKRRWTVARFPQLKRVCRKYGLAEVGTPYFAMGNNGYNLIEKAHVAPIKNGEKYKPYVSEEK
jgi:hypothetical protein